MSFVEYRLTSRQMIIIFMLVVLLTILMVLFPHRVNAAYANMPNVLPENVAGVGQQYINLTDGDQDEPTGYGAYLPDSYLKVYSNGKANRDIKIDVYDRNAGVARACRNYFVEWHMKAITANEDVDDGVDVAAGFFRVTRCTGEAGYTGWTFTIPDYAFVASSKLGHEGLYIAALNLKIVSESDGNHTATLKVNTSGDAKLGFMGSRAVTIYPSLLRARHTVTAKFRTPCDLSPGWHTVSWEDDDKGTGTTQDNNIWTTVKKYDMNGNPQPDPPVGAASWDGGSTASSGGQSVYFEPNFRYEFQFNNVQGGNGISVTYPWDSGDWDLPCTSWKVDSVTSSVVNPWVEIGSSVDFNHTVNSTSTTGSNPVFATRKANLDYAPWNSTNQPGTFPLGNQTVSDNDQKNKSIANSTGELGKQYCQSYTINPSEVNDGVSNNTSATSTAACTHVVGGKTKPVANRVSGDELAENGELIKFTAGLNTSNYTSYGDWGGYNIDCSWRVTRQPRGAPSPVATGATGSCDGDIRANGSLSTAAPEFTIPNDLANYPIGTQICIEVTINTATSVKRAASNPAFIDTPNPTSSCFYVSAKPFVRAYMSDVIAGGSFGQGGLVGSGELKGYLRGAHAGSGAEFAAIAAGSVEGYASATMRDLGTYPLPGKDLTFSNNVPASLGNYFSAASRQVKDWFVSTMEESTKNAMNDTTTAVDLATLTAGRQSYFKPPTGKLTISGSSAVRHTIYVDGDVVITQSIVIPSATTYSDPDAVPFFSLIVKGNIYIASGVNQLDGLFVAQPKDVTTGPAADQGQNKDKDSGIIYTCTQNDGSRIAVGTLYDSCNSKLQVNGALIAQKTKFLRTKGTLAEIAFTPEATTTTSYSANPVWVYDAADQAAALSTAGKSALTNAKCVKVQESLLITSPNDAWKDNWICTDKDAGLVFRDGGTWNGAATSADITAGKCVSWDIGSGSWADNYMCGPEVGLTKFYANSATDPSSASQQCVQIYDPSDNSWKLAAIHFNVRVAATGVIGFSTPKRWFCIKDPISQSTVTTPAVYDQIPFGSDKNAEEIRLSPEFYFGNPAFKPREDRSDSNGEYDSIITLPPIL